MSWSQPKVCLFPIRPRLVRAGKTELRSQMAYFLKQGVSRGILDCRCRQPGAGLRDRRESLGGAGPGGTPLNMPIEVRPVMSGAASRNVVTELR